VMALTWKDGSLIESSPNTVATLVYLMLGKQGIRDMITAVLDYEESLLAMAQEKDEEKATQNS